MNAPMTNEDVSKQGRQAAEVLENPVFQHVFDILKAEVVGAWTNASVRDTGGQQLLLQQMKVLNRVHETLVSLLKAGEDVDKILERHMRESEQDINEGGARKGMRAVRRVMQR
jgi:hypothetical protein